MGTRSADGRCASWSTFPADVDPTGDTVYVGPAQLKRLALARADVRGGPVEQLSPVRHLVDDRGELIERWTAAHGASCRPCGCAR